jgi:lysophospholipase L1-like esterase
MDRHAGSEPTVAFVGSSTVAGRGQVFDVVGELRRRPVNAGHTLINLGVGGDLSGNAIDRIPDVVAAQPYKIVVIVGGNDILASVFPNLARMLAGWKHAQRTPTPELYQQNLVRLIHGLQESTHAAIAVASLGQVGEDPDSANPVQQRLNELYELYRQIIRRTADNESISYIPFYERLHDHIQEKPGRAFTAFRLRSVYWDTFRHYVLRRSGDAIAAANGWRFHVDGIHLNSRGGLILADTIQEFLTADQ